MDRSGTGSRMRRTPSVSHRLRLTEDHAGVLDSLSNASLMEVQNVSHVICERSHFLKFVKLYGIVKFNNIEATVLCISLSYDTG